MNKIKEIILWVALGALLSLLLCGMYFCSLQAASGVAECSKSESNLCEYIEIFLQKEGMGPIGYININVRGSPRNLTA